MPLKNRKSIRLQSFDYSKPGLYFVTICIDDYRSQLFGEVINSKMVLSKFGQYAEECWRQIPVHFPDVSLDEYVIMPNHVHGIIEICPPRYLENEVDVMVQNCEPLRLHHHDAGTEMQIDKKVEGNRDSEGRAPSNVRAQNFEPVRCWDIGSDLNLDKKGEEDKDPKDGDPLGVRIQNFESVRPKNFRHLDLSLWNERLLDAESENDSIKVESDLNLYKKINRYQHIIPRSIGSIIRGFKIGVTKLIRLEWPGYVVWHRNFYENVIRDNNALCRIRKYIRQNPSNWVYSDEQRLETE